MGNKDWKTELKNHFENMRILEKCQAETLIHFEQFCEFIVEPAFEALVEEIASFGVKARIQKAKGRDIRLSLSFPGRKDEQFHYKISIPSNSVELRLALVTKGRKNLTSDYKTTEEAFMPDLSPAEVLKLTKDDVILDVLEHYRNFSYEALTSPD
ncbi:MAG: hypothetical protein ABSG73_03340 [Candidatus Aminicenantales bacterium]|jgi:hypothetical protein